MERETTIQKLFIDPNVQFAIPPYQRAYSWEKEKQLSQFITDLKEQPINKKYFLGHFLFEKDKQDENKYWVIDGQQRLTTLVIFFRCLINELERRKKSGEKIIAINGDEVELWRLSEYYLKFNKRRKLKTVEYDDNFFNIVIIDNEELSVDTQSKERIYEAREYFKHVFKEEVDTSILFQWKDIIEKAVVTTFEVADKVQATQIFAFQNDRGKDLTNLEKLKAFLIYQVYMNSDDEDETDAISAIECEFVDIYKQTERIKKLDEDQILNHHNTAFSDYWESPIRNIKKELQESQDKVKWIKSFCANLKDTFLNVEKIENLTNSDSFIGDVLILDAANSWPLLIKIYYYHKNHIENFERIFRLMEITLFKMAFSYGDYRTNHFNSYAKEYSGNEKELDKKLLNCAENGFKEYWKFDEDFKACLEGNSHYWQITRYLLWKYENKLKDESKDDRPMDANKYLNTYGSKRWDNTIEHITPQNPDEVVYSESFKNAYVDNLGNLVLMTLGKNSQLNNRMPIEKCDRFKNSALISQREVADTIIKDKEWKEKQIIERKEKIVRFALDNWKIPM